MTTEDQWNQINGSSSALGEGSFKRRDELRRAESVQRQKVKMGERLDRNISRAARKGDGASLNSFINARKAITGQAFGGEGGITNADDQDQRVAHGTIKGAKARYDYGNIGATNNGMIAEAPPANSVNPKNRPEGTGLTPDSPKSSSSGGEWVDVSGRGQGAPQTAPAALGPQTPSDVMADRAKAKLQGFKDGADNGAKFKADLDKWNQLPADQKKQSSIDNMMARGEQLGISPDQINASLRGEKDLSASGVAASAKVQLAERAKNKKPDSGSSEVANISKKYAGQGIQDGDKELAEGLQTMSPEAKARSEKDAASIAYGKKSSVDYDAAEALRVSNRTKGFDKIATQEKKDAKDNADATKAVNLVRKGLEANTEDVKKNSKDFLGPDVTGNPLTWFNQVIPQAKRMFTDGRKDAQAPGMDWDSFDKRDPSDPNFGQKVYQSQYDSKGNFTQDSNDPNYKMVKPNHKGGPVRTYVGPERVPHNRATTEAARLEKLRTQGLPTPTASNDFRLQRERLNQALGQLGSPSTNQFPT